MKISKMLNSCFTGQVSQPEKKDAAAGQPAYRVQKPRTSIVVDMLNGRVPPEARATNAKPAPRSAFQRLIKAMQPARTGKGGEPARTDGVTARAASTSSRPSFDLKLESGKVRVLPLHPAFTREQARRLERELNDKRNRAVSVAWNADSHGYTVSYSKDGMRRWVGTMGPVMPIVALAPHHATAELVAPPPVGMLAGLSGSADGGLWRIHDGKLYRWEGERQAWKHVETPADGRGPVELMGRQLDGHAWARYGSLLMKLGAQGIEEGHQWRDADRHLAVRIGPAGERLALDAEGALRCPDEPGGLPRPISLQLADGRAAFEKVVLGNPDEPVARARPVDFQLAPDGKTLFLRDRAGHLYQADLGASGGGGEIAARRMPNPLRQPGSREAWRADALAVAPGASAGESVLHAVFSSNNGQRLSAVWHGNQWVPQFHVEQPLLLLNDRGIEPPDIAKTLDDGNGAALGMSRDGRLYTKDGDHGWRPLVTADGKPVANVADLKFGPSGLSDGKSVYVRQQDRDGSSRILELEVGGKLASLPARTGGSVVALPSHPHLGRANVLAASDAPIRDFAVDGKGVAYHVANDRGIVRTPPGAEPEHLPPLPGRARVEQIAVSGDGNQLFALARGPLQHGDAERMPTLFRFDRQSRAWVNCRINVSWDAPLHLSISNLGTLQLAIERADGARQLHRVLPPTGGRDTYRLQAMAPGEPAVTKTVTDVRGKRVRIPGTGAFATVSQTRAGVTERGKGAFSAARGHVERVLTMPAGAARRVREQRNGRDDMAAEYGAMRTIHEDLEQLLSGAHFPLPPVAMAGAFEPPVVGESVARACASLRGDALAGMTADLRRIGVRTGVLGPDFRPTADAQRRKQAAAAAKPDTRDLLPRMIEWLAELAARAQADAGRVPVRGTGGPSPVFSEQERDGIQQGLTLMRQLHEHGVTLPEADPALRRDNGQDTAVLTGAVARHLLTLERATRMVATPGTDSATEPYAAVEALKRQVADDKVLRLARFGFSGWEDAEAHWEVVQSFRQEVSKPRAPLARKLKESLAIENVRQADEVAVRLGEAMKGLSNRSTLFGIESRGASVGATASGAVFTRAGAWGFATLGIDRTTMVGVERTADQLAEGPLVAFFVRQSTKSMTLGSGFGLDFKPLNRVIGTRVQAQVQGTAGLMHGKGAAMLVEPEDIDEFCRRLCDPSEDPGRVLELGINRGAIGLDMREQQVALGATAGGLAGYADPVPAFGPPTGNAAHAFQQTALQRGFVGGGVNWTARDFLLKLQHAWEPISGYEYQGGRGWTANAFASLVEQGGLLPHVSDAFSLALRSLNITLQGATVEWSGVESFKRTLDWKTATPVEPKAWQDLAAQAKAVFPSQVIGHLSGAGFKAVVAAKLDEARTTWSATSEHERAAFVNLAEQMLLQDTLAEQGRAMLMPGAKIEINIPNVGALEDGRKRSKAHRSLGPVMESSLHARDSIPGLANAMKAMAKVQGTNDTRFVFQMDPAFINLVNRQMLEGTMSWDELNVLARTLPAPYRLTEICGKNSDTNRSAFSINPLPVLAFTDSAEASQSLFTAEAHLRYGLDGRIIGCDLLPGAQRAVRDQPLLRAFAKDDVHPVRADARPLPPQRPDLPRLGRSQSQQERGGERTRAKPFSSSLS